MRFPRRFNLVDERERALEWLEIGYERRDSHLPHLRLMHAFRPLLPDPRLRDLLGRLELPVATPTLST